MTITLTRFSPKTFITFLVLCVGLAYAAERDFYKILGIKRNANAAQIKKAYRKLSFKYHPDKNQGDEKAREMFQDISAANEMLTDPDKRRRYDRCGEKCVAEHEQQQQQGGGGSPFGDFFGHGQRQQEEQLGPSLTLKIRATLEDLYEGKDFELTYNKKTICPHCRGSGADDPDHVHDCNKCNGSGHIIKNQEIMPGFVQQVQVTCPKCDGTGKRNTSTCHVCHGHKLTDSIDSLVIFVEKGTPDGKVLEYQDAADEYTNVRAGNVRIKVEQLKHPVFERNGDDLKATIRITLREALLGFVKPLKHLGGHSLDLDRAGQITKPGHVDTIPGEGMPKAEYNSERGDLYITYDVVFPKELTYQQKVDFKEFFA